MKYYLALFTNRSGERETGDLMLVRAPSVAEAEELAKGEMLIYQWADPDEVEWNGDELYLVDEIVEFDELREISESEFSILRKHIAVAREPLGGWNEQK